MGQEAGENFLWMEADPKEWEIGKDFFHNATKCLWPSNPRKEGFLFHLLISNPVDAFLCLIYVFWSIVYEPIIAKAIESTTYWKGGDYFIEDDESLTRVDD